VSLLRLTSAAAEVMFRRRLWKRTAVFLTGSLVFPYASQFFPPLDLDLMLVFFGVLFFIGLAIAVILDRRAQNRQEIEVLKRVYSGFIHCRGFSRPCCLRMERWIRQKT